MPAKVAQSALRVPHSRIRELAEIAMSMDGVLKLYFGESNVPTPDFIKQAAQKAMADGFTFYTENAGLPSLRQALAKYYQDMHQVSLDPIQYDSGNLKVALSMILMSHTRDLKGEMGKSLTLPGVSSPSRSDEDDLIKMASQKLVNDFAANNP